MCEILTQIHHFKTHYFSFFLIFHSPTHPEKSSPEVTVCMGSWEPSTSVLFATFASIQSCLAPKTTHDSPAFLQSLEFRVYFIYHHSITHVKHVDRIGWFVKKYKIMLSTQYKYFMYVDSPLEFMFILVFSWVERPIDWSNVYTCSGFKFKGVSL